MGSITRGGGGGTGTLTDTGLWGCAIKQGRAFGVRILELGILFGVELYDWETFLPSQRFWGPNYFYHYFG